MKEKCVISRTLFGEKKYYGGCFLGEPKFQSQRGNAATFDDESEANNEAQRVGISDYSIERL